MHDDDKRHGTKYGYQLGCRLDCCRSANTRALKRWRAGLTSNLIDATGTVRRVQALVALGWTLAEISQEAGGYTKNWSHLLLKQQTVTTDTAKKIAATYDRLSMRVPDGPYRERTRRRAQRNGWLPPLAWIDIDDLDERPDLTARDDSVDEVVVLRFLGGDLTVRTNRAERYEIVRRWHGSDAELERHTGWNVPRLRREMTRPAQEVA